MIKVGILGCANIAKRFLMPAFSQHPEFVLSFIGSRDPSVAKECADMYGCRSGTYEELVSSDVDFVYIPVPNALHHEWVVKCLDAGKHVLCEKSLGVSYEEVADMVSHAEYANRFLMESFQWRFHSQTLSIHNLLSEGAIGEVRNLETAFGFPPFPDKNNIRYKRNLGGGALLDAGAYTIMATTEFLGTDVRVKSSCLRYAPGCDVDVGGSILLCRADGTASLAAFGFDNFYQCSIRFWGSKGKLTASRIFTAPPGFAPEVVLETTSGTVVKKLQPDNHFFRLLDYVSAAVADNDHSVFKIEREKCMIQAKLMADVRNMSDE